MRFVVDSIVRFVKENNKGIWGKPVVAFADANDPLFLKLKDVVSETHKTPHDFLDSAKTVICYFIPFNEEIVKSNVNGAYSSKEWATAYIETNRLIVDLNKYLSEKLEKFGYKTVILPPTHNFDEERFVSDWSHKHVGFVAGLGKFGLHNQLITKRGCCGRLGSLITDADIVPNERPKEEFCLYKSKGICRVCVEKCKFNALKVNSFDRKKCYEICLKNAEVHKDIGFADVCGKCVCVTPCSFEIPRLDLIV